VAARLGPGAGALAGGLLFYGAFTAKMLVLRAEVPRWVLPALGGAVFTAVTALWLTSAVWFFTTSGLTI
jgi:hypothetical protein